MAGMPVYDLLGGKCREAVSVYRHTDGATPEEVEENVRRYMEDGYRYLRCQMGTYGGQMGKGKHESFLRKTASLVLTMTRISTVRG